ncbi:HAD family hydrolase [Palleronia abyssalis]|uniref:Phosphoglycolate phosphatase n=1 Tax=Palleronia abyssalis TaxID=1501240 RepID=A0A2R8BZX9_9RHOB|nr:HAD family hydrolase [Palleronia abyssalis]SPJ25718.1 Phosphoglycolate phosphatase [Palleronia abyssalis]
MAVCFDAFGALVEIADRRDPYRTLLRALPPMARRECARRLMREDRATPDWPVLLGCEIPADVLARVEAAIRDEANSIRMRPGFRAAWAALRAKNLKLAVCSNLAAPYGPPLRAALPDAPDAVALSYELGTIKPELALYAAVARMLALPPDRIVFVGDSRAADIDGPRRAGMQAMHVTDFERAMSAGEELLPEYRSRDTSW